MSKREKSTHDRKATIEDVAAHAGVAVGTVSRFLNGAKLRNANQEKIAAAIEELGFRRNVGAARIQKQNTQIIGMLVSSLDQFYSALIEKVSDHLLKEGYLLIPISKGEQVNKVASAMKYFRDQDIDALILTGDTTLLEETANVRKIGLPVVIFNNDLKEMNTDRVLVNNRAAMFQATQHLIDLGHSEIGFLCGDPRESSAVDRRQGYLDALDTNGIPVTKSLLAANAWTEESGYLGTHEILTKHPNTTAIIGSSYIQTLGLLNFLKGSKRECPRDISVVSFDDVDLFKQLTPGITAIAQPVHDIAKYIASFVVSRLSAKPAIAMRSICLECQMIQRGSVLKRN